jgi:hypothetical protein
MSNDPPWLHVGSDVRVELSTLQDFADSVGALHTAFNSSVTEGIQPMFMAAVAVPFAGGGLAEGTGFGQSHLRCAMAIQQLLMEAQMGLGNLSRVARAVAAEYGAADAFSAATLEAVTAAFEPVPLATGDQEPLSAAELQEMQDRAENDFAGMVDGQRDGTGGSDAPPMGDGIPGEENVHSTEPTVIAEGEPGQYVIPGDSDGVAANPSPLPGQNSLTSPPLWQPPFPPDDFVPDLLESIDEPIPGPGRYYPGPPFGER